MFQFAKEGYPFIAVFATVTVLAFMFRMHWTAVAALILTLFMLYFFRDPDRLTPRDDDAFFAPADGKVIVIKEAEEKELLKAKAVMIGIFMSPLNVHVNRVPCDGTVREVKHFPGSFFKAFTDEASEKNEHITMLYECGKHGPVVMKQIAGSVARRAVCRVQPGDTLKQGERYGMIKFSSRVDIFLPLGTEVNVQLGDRVLAGETVLGFRSHGSGVRH